jgi:outer membrane protein assembly factor BamB
VYTPVVSGGNVYIGSNDHNLYCLNAQTGAKVWNDTAGSWVFVPAVSGGYVYVGSADKNVYCVNAQTGEKVWSYLTGSFVLSSPAVAGGNVYIGSDDHNVYCLNAQTGAKVWSYLTKANVISSPAVAGGKIYIGSDDHKIYCLDAQTGAKVWNYTAGSNVYSSPAVAGSYVYFGSLDKNVYCLNAQTGERVWSYATGGQVSSSPAISGGFVYVGSDDHKVYAFAATTGGIKVMVVDNNGNPIVGASISSTNQPTGQAAVNGVTGSDGSISVTGTTPGSYTFEAKMTGYVTNSGTTSVSAGSTANLSINLQVQPTVAAGGIKVTVLDGGGKPIAGASISSTSTPSGQAALSGISGSDGSITFNGVVAGSYTFQASMSGYVTGSGSATVAAGSVVTSSMTLQTQSTGGSSPGGVPGYTYEEITAGIILVVVMFIWLRRRQ